MSSFKTIKNLNWKQKGVLLCVLGPEHIWSHYTVTSIIIQSQHLGSYKYCGKGTAGVCL